MIYGKRIMNPSVTDLKTLLTGEILIVDDIPANLHLLSTMLTEQGYRVRPARNGDQTLMSARSAPPDLILLDIKMPDLNGYEVCEQLKADPRTCDIPVIFISALDQTEDKVKAFTYGGVDYITKPFQVEEVLARVKTHLVLYSLQKQLIKVNSQLQESNELLKAEIEKRVQIEAILQKYASTDALTNLLNRRHFFDLAEKELIRAKRYQLYFSLLLIDLDNFKTVNDKHGHLIGDHLLQVVAECIRQNSREVDINGRYGGDEFVVLLPETQPPFSQVFAERLCQIVPQQLEKMKEITFPVTLSIGIANFSGESSMSIDTLFDRADQALYLAKEAGRNRLIVWNKTDEQ